MRIEPFSQLWIAQAKEFSDKAIGVNYFSEDELRLKEKQSWLGKHTASFVIVDQDKVLGLRISYPHGNWSHGKGSGLSSQLWPHPLEETAYFQSLYIDPSIQGQGWGKKMSLQSIEVLKRGGAKGVVCHSWVESPGDSSGKYLRSLNFQSICKYPEYWKPVDYQCPRCGSPCLCTAEEMYLDFSKELE